MKKSLDEKLKECKSVVIHEGVEECNKLLLDRQHKLLMLNGDFQGLVKGASDPFFKAERGDNITGVPGLGVPSDTELSKLMDARQMPVTPELLTRAIPWFGSDERVDGDGDIVRQNWNFDEFKDNSPMPFSHRWEQPPVGRVIDWKVVERKDTDYSGPALWLLCMFATADEWDFADSVFRLVKTGILKGGSVGFFSTRIIDITDEEERNELGLGRFGLILDQNTLLEFSPATIPANPGAVALRARKHGPDGLKSHDMTVIRELARQQVHDEEQLKKWPAYEEVLLSACRNLFPKSTFSFHKDMDVPVTASVVLEVEETPAITVEEPTMEEMKVLTQAIEDLAKSFGEFRSGVDAKFASIEETLKSHKPAETTAEIPPVETISEPSDSAAGGITAEIPDDLKTLFGNLDILKKQLEPSTSDE